MTDQLKSQLEASRTDEVFGGSESELPTIDILENQSGEIPPEERVRIDLNKVVDRITKRRKKLIAALVSLGGCALLALIICFGLIDINLKDEAWGAFGVFVIIAIGGMFTLYFFLRASEQIVSVQNKLSKLALGPSLKSHSLGSVISEFHELLRIHMPNFFEHIDPFEFENVVAEVFRKLEYEVTVTRKTGDGGADLIAKKDGKSYAVQVKRYAEGNKVGVQDINQVLGAQRFYKCDASIVVTTSDYTEAGRNHSRTVGNLELWNGDDLRKKIRDLFLQGMARQGRTFSSD